MKRRTRQENRAGETSRTRKIPAGAGPKSKKGKRSGGAAAVNGQLTQTAATQPAPPPPKEQSAPGEHEKSAAVLSKLKEMEFHSRQYRGAGTINVDDRRRVENKQTFPSRSVRSIQRRIISVKDRGADRELPAKVREFEAVGLSRDFQTK